MIRAPQLAPPLTEMLTGSFVRLGGPKGWSSSQADPTGRKWQEALDDWTSMGGNGRHRKSTGAPGREHEHEREEGDPPPFREVGKGAVQGSSRATSALPSSPRCPQVFRYPGTLVLGQGPGRRNWSCP